MPTQKMLNLMRRKAKKNPVKKNKKRASSCTPRKNPGTFAEWKAGEYHKAYKKAFSAAESGRSLPKSKALSEAEDGNIDGYYEGLGGHGSRKAEGWLMAYWNKPENTNPNRKSGPRSKRATMSRRRNPAKAPARAALPSDAHLIFGHDGETAAYYFTTVGGKPAMRTYWGAKRKPYSNYSYARESSRTQDLYRFMVKWEKEKKDRIARAAKKKNYKNPLQVGDILYTMWGYDQTNVEWFIITDRTDKSVKVAEIAGNRTADEYMSGTTRPAKPIKKIEKESGWRRVLDYGRVAVRIDESRTAYAWDGKPKGYSSYA